eukprot:TRINITY_DN8882_c0_g1_i3.p1 TRINITY_DN8882_c0_g1~~TRINITY_DN8882_c0_g1_i3.p1  ORF type:complete len:150 (+),score=23.89 TRINITY_DN8882_c0_g1_i3:200-649(+)
MMHDNRPPSPILPSFQPHWPLSGAFTSLPTIRTLYAITHSSVTSIEEGHATPHSIDDSPRAISPTTSATQTSSPPSADVQHQRVKSPQPVITKQHKRKVKSYTPINSYIAFTIVQRTKVRQDHPSATNQQILQILGEMWRSVPPNERTR